MDEKKLSIELQKAYCTYYRNKEIIKKFKFSSIKNFTGSSSVNVDWFDGNRNDIIVNESLQTISYIYLNQLINSMPHEEDPTIYDTITIALSLKEVQMVTAQFTTTPRNQKNSSTVNRGNQQGTTANPKQTGSALSGLLGVKG